MGIQQRSSDRESSMHLESPHFSPQPSASSPMNLRMLQLCQLVVVWAAWVAWAVWVAWAAWCDVHISNPLSSSLVNIELVSTSAAAFFVFQHRRFLIRLTYYIFNFSSVLYACAPQPASPPRLRCACVCVCTNVFFDWLSVRVYTTPLPPSGDR